MMSNINSTEIMIITIAKNIKYPLMKRKFSTIVGIEETYFHTVRPCITSNSLFNGKINS